MNYEGFVGSAYSGQSVNWETQELINWFLQRAENPHSKSPNILLPVPGFSVFALVLDAGGTAGVRGAFAQNDRTFAVIGDKFFELFRDGTYLERPMTLIGFGGVTPTVTPSPPPAQIDAPNAPTVVIGGDPGATTYGYKVTALNERGETEASAEGTTTNGNATLSGTNYNVVAWNVIEGATVGYKVYRTTGGAVPPKLIAVVGPDTHDIQDIGGAGTAVTPPVTNTTGGTAGTTPYGYKVTAMLGLRETEASAEGTTLTGQAALDAENFNTISWPDVIEDTATGYRIYRTTGLTTPRLIGEVGQHVFSFDDTGIEGETVTPPSVNETGTDVIIDDGCPAFIYANGDAGDQLLIVSGGFAYCYNLVNNVLAPVLEGATKGGYINSYFLVLDAATSTVKMSESLDGFVWDAAQVYQRTAAGDRWVSLQVNNSDIWIFGAQTTDIWVPTADPDTRITPLPNVFVEQGTAAYASVTRLKDKQIWLGADKDGAGVVYMSDGYTPVRISTHAVEHQIQRYTSISDAFAWTYQEDGHTFYLLSFPSADRTWVYDLDTQEWHKRGENDDGGDEFTMLPIFCHCYAFGSLGEGMHIVGFTDEPIVYRMSSDTANGIHGSIVRMRRAPHINQEHQRLKFNDLEFDLDRGIGVAAAGSSEEHDETLNPSFIPRIRVRWSDNGGATYGNFLQISAGEQADWKIKPTVRKFGMASDRVTEIRVSAARPWRLCAAYVRVTPTNDLKEPGRMTAGG